MATADEIIAWLNLRGVDIGVAQPGTATAERGMVKWVAPVPSMGGGFATSLEIRNDGKLYDETLEETFPSFEAWTAELERIAGM